MQELTEQHLLQDPFRQFAKWYEEACHNSEILLPSAMCLATIDMQGFPDSRFVLLKEFSKEGFVFFTNTNSPKGKSLFQSNKASLAFYWERLKKQVRILGTAELVSHKEADDYFKTRPRESQIGAWASDQSQPVEDRKTLDQKFKEYSKTFEGKPILRPPYWTGFRIKPLKIEFWQECPSRMHDRFLFTRASASSPQWKIQRLYP